MAKEAATYVHGHHSSVVTSHARRTAQDSMAFVLPHLKPTDTVLDLGCGPGSITADLAALLPDGHITGGDAVTSVLETARSHAASRNLTNITFAEMDGNALPFADDTFDAVLAHQVLQHVADPIAILKEMRRVTKKNGIVAARDADYGSFAWYPEPPLLEKWMSAYERVARAGGGNPRAARYLPSWAKAAGFDAEQVTYSWSTWHYADAQARAWGDSWAERALHSAFASTAAEHGILTAEELQGLAGAWRAWGGMEGAFIRIPSGEVLCRKS